MKPSSILIALCVLALVLGACGERAHPPVTRPRRGSDGPVCPACGEASGVPIVYKNSTEERAEKARKREIKLEERNITSIPMPPNYYCYTCDVRWTTRTVMSKEQLMEYLRTAPRAPPARGEGGGGKRAQPSDGSDAADDSEGREER